MAGWMPWLVISQWATGLIVHAIAVVLAVVLLGRWAGRAAAAVWRRCGRTPAPPGHRADDAPGARAV
ncbi:hypothetical protein [Streptomyces sp. CAU 1734]|uniref:hypothetical protein n=1 Tax=Streptomyces sp. CAU 1734 TaxID=3140360 RepID=UPI0032606A99